MRRELCGFTCLLLLCMPVAAFGDSLFNLNGTLADGTGTFKGTLSYNAGGNSRVTGTVTDGSFSFTIPNNYLGEQLGYPTFTTVNVFPVLSPQFDLDLIIPNAVLAGNAGGALCSLQTFCPGTGTPSSFSESGLFPQQVFLTITATPVSPAPEPGTLGLLGTGLLGLVAVARRRLGSIFRV